MKRFYAWIMVLAMSLLLLAGCGGNESPTGQTTEPVKQGNAVSDGYWVVERIEMEGAEFSGTDMTDLFGPADTIMAIAFDADGAFNAVFFEDHLKSSYTLNDTSLEMDLGGEKVKGSVADDTLLLTSKDGSFTLKRQDKMPDSLANNPWVTYAPDFNAEQTMAMSNFMALGWYLIDDDVLYGLTHSQSLDGNLGATPFHMKGDFPEFEEAEILDANGRANYLCKEGDTLYYVLNFEKICKVNTDGSGAAVLYEGACDYLQIHEGRLYFADENYHFVSTDMNGGDLKTVVDKEIYYPYFICSDWMIFQDDADDESLHLYNTTHGTELNITYVPSYQPILDGKYLYYADTLEESYVLCRIDMSDPNTFRHEASELPLLESGFLIDDKYIYTTNGNSVDKADWKKLTDAGTVTEEIDMYVSEAYTIFHELDEQGLITGKHLMSKLEGGGNMFP